MSDKSHKIIDLSREITPTTPCHPYDTQLLLKKTKDLLKDHYTDYRLTIGMHAGTHIDGPQHLLESSIQISQINPSHFVGPGVLIDARNKKIDATLALHYKIPNESIVLIHTGHDIKYKTPEYFTQHQIITDDFANILIEKNIKMIGIDTPSPDQFPFSIHKKLLSKYILIIENLTKLEELYTIRQFLVIALPLKINADSSPAHVIAL